ncbi:MAG: LytR C-terminal domain-containing protein [bacterium]
MARPQRRRVRPFKKPPARSRRRKAVRRSKPDLRGSLMKIFIGLVLVADLVLVFFIIRQCSKPAGMVEEDVPEKEVVLQVEVMNGCGVQGIANTFMDFLRKKKIDVVRTGNYEEEEFGRPNFNVDRTVIIDRRGNLRNSIKIARAMDLGEDRVIQQVNSAYLIDATIIIGRDFQQLSCWLEMEK